MEGKGNKILCKTSSNKFQKIHYDFEKYGEENGERKKCAE